MKTCGFSSWYVRTEFLTENLSIIGKLSYIAPNTIRVIRVDHIYSQVIALHKGKTHD